MAVPYTCSRCLFRVVSSAKAPRQLSNQIRSITTRPSAAPKSIRVAGHKSLNTNARNAQASAGTQAASSIDLSRQPPPPGEAERVLLKSNNLFHSFTDSPSPEIRRRAAFIKQHAYCPHTSHNQTRMPANPDDSESLKPRTGGAPPAHVRYECPDCGIPVACCEEHFVDEYESHLEICDTLREINEDDHDLRSGRIFPEFQYPNETMDEQFANMTSWDTLLYTRDFQAINEMRSMRQVTRMLTYPVTIGSVLHELSPYNIRKGGRLTTEGLKSFSALQYSLHPPRDGSGEGIKGLRPKPPPVRIFILGARAESSLPREVWVQLAHLFPRSTFHLVMIGPESMINRDAEYPLPERTPSNPFGAVIEDRISKDMKISTYVEYYHTLHQAGHFYPYDPYFDCFVLFHPGLGHPASSHEWEDTIPLLLDTKVPIIATGYTEWDMQRDLDWVKSRVGGEMDLLLEPGENRFRSLRWDLNDMDPQDVSCGNWGVWAFRGKRYDTTQKD